MCSSTRGPATAPSLVTWPTRRSGVPVRLAKPTSRAATSRTCPTDPAAPCNSAQAIVWTESTASTRGRSSSAAARAPEPSVSLPSSSPERPAPATRPPPTPRSSSPMPVRSRSPFSRSTQSMGMGPHAPRCRASRPAADGPAARSSTSEAHALHSGQRPSQRGARKPHSWQTCSVFTFAAAPALATPIPPPGGCLAARPRTLPRGSDTGKDAIHGRAPRRPLSRLRNVESVCYGPRLAMRRSPLAILFVTVFLDLLGFGIVVPFLAYYVESFGAKASTVGLLMSAFSLAQFLFAPIWGRLSDRVGRRPIILVGLFGSAIGFTLFGLAGSLPLLFIGRIVAGVAGATIPPPPAHIAHRTSPGN